MSSCRVVGVIDADAFEVQVYQKLQEWAHTIGKPCVVALKTGRILAISNEAKKFGITRQMKVPEAKRKHKGLLIITKKDRFTKPETKLLNQHSYGIRSAIIDFVKDLLDEMDVSEEIKIEKVGNDEYFLDLTGYVDALIDQNLDPELDTTKRVFVEGGEKVFKGRQLAHRVKKVYPNDDGDEEELRLAFGLEVIQNLCDYIGEKVDIVCSGGVSSNKLLAKLACKLNKPNGVTSLTRDGFKRVSPTVSFREITGFGGDLGTDIADIFGEQSIQQLRNLLRNRANYNELVTETDSVKAAKARHLLNGVCHDKVEDKVMFDGMTCRRNYLKIRSQAEFNAELNYLAQHMRERLQEEVEYNKRFATGIQIQYLRRLKNGRIEKSEFFDMTFDPATKIHSDGEGSLEIDEAEFFQDALYAVTSNKNFDSHVQYIVGICFSVTGFNQFGSVEE